MNFTPNQKNRFPRNCAALWVLGWALILMVHPTCGQTLQYEFTTLAGLGGGDGLHTDPRLTETPHNIAVDGAGNLYVADTDTHTIRKITPTGVLTTLAGLAGSSGSADGTGNAARFHFPEGVAVDGTGNVYVSDSYTIRKITQAGVVTTLAGLPGHNGSADGQGGAARFALPSSLAVDSPGNIYVAEKWNHTVRKVTPAGMVTTLAGLAGNSGSTDGVGNAARFFAPSGVAVDNAGNVYVGDTENATLRKITAAGVVTTLAGSAGVIGSADGAGNASRFYGPTGVAVDSAGNVYVADTRNNTIRKVTPAGVVTTLAGLAGVTGGSTDGTGSAARFNLPQGLAVDTEGNVYVGEKSPVTFRKISPTGVVTTRAEHASVGAADGTGSAARFNFPRRVAMDASGNLYVMDRLNQTIRKVTSAGLVTTLAGLADVRGTADGIGSAARFDWPSDVAVDRDSNLYVTDYFNRTIRKVTPTGLVTTLAGLANASGSADGIGNAARFNGPSGAAVDNAANIYVADTGNNAIRKVTPAGVVTTLAGLAGSEGSADGIGNAARFYGPSGVTVDTSGNLYVADSANHTIRKVTPAGAVTTLAGLASFAGSADGTGSAARFRFPSGVAVDIVGNVYVADAGNHTIRQVTPFGAVKTLAGLAGAFGSTDGMGSATRFLQPQGVMVDSAGNLYIADSGNNTIRKGTLIPTQFIQLSRIHAQNNTVTLEWNAQGTNFRVQYKNSLSDPDWIFLGDVTTNGASATHTSDIGGVSARFYRVLLVP